jgi:hypothetical protein
VVCCQEKTELGCREHRGENDVEWPGHQREQSYCRKYPTYQDIFRHYQHNRAFVEGIFEERR